MNTRNIKSLILFAVAILACTLVKAQIENTRERLITQLKNGTAPGLLFAPSQPDVAPIDKNKISTQQQKESLITQIRKGTAPGMKFQGGGSVTGARPGTPVGAGTSRTTVAKWGPLASEMEMPKELPKMAITPVVPTQEEGKPTEVSNK